MKTLRKVLETITEKLLMASGYITSITIILMVVFLFREGMRICVCHPVCSGMNMPDPTIICRKIGFGCEKCLNLHFRLRIVKSNSK